MGSGDKNKIPSLAKPPVKTLFTAQVPAQKQQTGPK